jgi:hypothetical protein
MMRRMMGRPVVSLLFLIAIASVARAQGVPAGSSEVSLPIGFVSKYGIDNNMHITYGGAFAYNLRARIAVVGEYTYQPLGQANGYKADSQLFGFAGRYYFTHSSRMIPYVVAGGGYYRGDDILVGSSTHTLVKGGYLGAGGGVSLYAGANVGFRPEFRYQREGFNGSTSGSNVAQGTISIFYQFSGEGGK